MTLTTYIYCIGVFGLVAAIVGFFLPKKTETKDLHNDKLVDDGRELAIILVSKLKNSFTRVKAWDNCRQQLRLHLTSHNLWLCDFNVTNDELESIRKRLKLKKKKNSRDFAEAEKWLGYARCVYDDVTACIYYFREYAEKAHATLEDFETSERELAHLLIKGYIACANKWLKYAQEPIDDVTACIKYFRMYAAKAGKTIGDFKTNKQKLKILKIRGLFACAMKWLGYAMNNPYSRKNCVYYFLEYTGKAIATILGINNNKSLSWMT